MTFFWYIIDILAHPAILVCGMDKQTDLKPVRYSRRHVFDKDIIPIMAGRCLLEGRCEPHYHDFMEIFSVLGGSGIQQTASGEIPIKKGDTFIMRPGVWHFDHDCRHLDIYVCCFGVELLQRELAWIRKEPALNYLFWTGPLSFGHRGILHIVLPRTSLVTYRRHLDALKKVQQDGRLHGRIDQIACLLSIFGELARNISSTQRVLNEQTVHPHPAVLTAVQLLEQDIAHPWSLSKLARQVHLDRFYLSRLFKAQMGLSPMAYLAHHRAERAASLLLRTKRAAAKIGQEVGWPEQSHFTRRFKAHFGLSPTAYRTHPVK